MNSITETLYLRIEAITPVHVGSGDSFVPEFDFTEEGNKLKFIDQGLFFRQISQLSEKDKLVLAKVLENGKVLDIVRTNPRFREAIRYELPKPAKLPNDYKKQIREGSGLPLLPGSSLKGSLVTAVLAHLVQQSPQVLQEEVRKILAPGWKNPPKHAGDDLLKKLIGSDPNHSLMRLLRVGDAVFYQAETRPLIARVTRLATPPHKFQEKTFAMGIEALLPGSVGQCRIDLDAFLRNYCTPNYGFPEGKQFSIDLLFAAIKTRTRHLLESEIAFLLNKQGDHQASLLATAQHLLERHNQSSARTSLLPVGWGIGWRGMTGQLLEKDLYGPNAKLLREKLKLSVKSLHYPFPKSRRVALTEKGPLPLGWLELKQIEPDEFACQQTILLDLRHKRLRISESADFAQRQAEALLRQQQEEQRREEAAKPWLVWIGALGQVDNWGELKQWLDKAEYRTHRDQPALAEAVLQAGMRVYQTRPDKWEAERQELVNQWLAETGLQMQIETPAETRDADCDLIDSLRDYGDYRQRTMDPAQLSRMALQLLVEKMKAWGCDNRKAKKDKIAAYEQVVKCLKASHK